MMERLYQEFKMSALYFNMTRAQKRKMTLKRFKANLLDNMKMRMYCSKLNGINKIVKKTRIRKPYIWGWKYRKGINDKFCDSDSDSDGIF